MQVDKDFFLELIIKCLGYVPSVPQNTVFSQTKSLINFIRSDYYTWFSTLILCIPPDLWTEASIKTQVLGIETRDENEEFLLTCSFLVQLAHFSILKNGCFSYVDIAANCLFEVFNVKYRERFRNTHDWNEFERYCGTTLQQKRNFFREKVDESAHRKKWNGRNIYLFWKRIEDCIPDMTVAKIKYKYDRYLKQRVKTFSYFQEICQAQMKDEVINLEVKPHFCFGCILTDFYDQFEESEIQDCRLCQRQTREDCSENVNEEYLKAKESLKAIKARLDETLQKERHWLKYSLKMAADDCLMENGDDTSNVENGTDLSMEAESSLEMEDRQLKHGLKMVADDRLMENDNEDHSNVENQIDVLFAAESRSEMEELKVELYGGLEEDCSSEMESYFLAMGYDKPSTQLDDSSIVSVEFLIEDLIECNRIETLLTIPSEGMPISRIREIKNFIVWEIITINRTMVTSLIMASDIFKHKVYFLIKLFLYIWRLFRHVIFRKKELKDIKSDLNLPLQEHTFSIEDDTVKNKEISQALDLDAKRDASKIGRVNSPTFDPVGEYTIPIEEDTAENEEISQILDLDAKKDAVQIGRKVNSPTFNHVTYTIPPEDDTEENKENSKSLDLDILTLKRDPSKRKVNLKTNPLREYARSLENSYVKNSQTILDFTDVRCILKLMEDDSFTEVERTITPVFEIENSVSMEDEFFEKPSPVQEKLDEKLSPFQCDSMDFECYCDKAAPQHASRGLLGPQLIEDMLERLQTMIRRIFPTNLPVRNLPGGGKSFTFEYCEHCEKNCARIFYECFKKYRNTFPDLPIECFLN